MAMLADSDSLMWSNYFVLASRLASLTIDDDDYRDDAAGERRGQLGHLRSLGAKPLSLAETSSPKLLITAKSS